VEPNGTIVCGTFHRNADVVPLCCRKFLWGFASRGSSCAQAGLPPCAPDPETRRKRCQPQKEPRHDGATGQRKPLHRGTPTLWMLGELRHVSKAAQAAFQSFVAGFRRHSGTTSAFADHPEVGPGGDRAASPGTGGLGEQNSTPRGGALRPCCKPATRCGASV
jgi:hypothetical protein